MVSTRGVLVNALIPVAVVLLVVLFIVLGRANATDRPDCASRNVDGSDSLVCSTPSPGVPTAG